MPVDPIAQFNRWFRDAVDAGISLPEAMALATVDGRGRPSVRYVLLKQADQRGFTFYTNLVSRKARDLAANPHASVVFYWDALGRQVRVEGRVQAVAAAEADAYWATRPRESQLAALASRQSHPIANHALLLQRWQDLCKRFEGKSVPRPQGWTGFRIIPARIEFWTRGDHRLHKREEHTRGRQGWKKRLLQP